MHQKLAVKFFNNQSTPAETQKVLEWFETSEGKRFLLDQIENDRVLMERDDLRFSVPELDSEKLFTSIQQEIRNERKKISIKRIDWLGHSIKAAATIFVILTAALFAITHEKSITDKVTEKEPVIFQTEDEQHREIKLRDGSLVRLNENSELTISEDFMSDKREIRLAGEAFFDVAHNSEKPFIIHTGSSYVEVLGTSFNVRSIPDEDNVQVAVVEGRVSFSADEAGSSGNSSVVLSKGQYGFLDVVKRSIVKDEMAIDNYLAWKSGRFIFDKITLSQACTQLYRLYNLDCSFEDNKMSKLHLTANFSNESIEKTLSVIALTLNIEYKLDDEKVIWTEQPIGPNGKGNS